MNVSRIDKRRFFENYRILFGKIRLTKTVETINTILSKAESESISIAQLAYILATSYHEAKHRKYSHDFYPIVERGSWRYIVKRYWYNSKVRKWLGNKSINEAWLYRGRGLVQLTGKTNYQRFGLVYHPEEALETYKAVDILFRGMEKGMFTGKALKHYINDKEVDFYNARRIINGIDKANLIATYAEKFKQILLISNSNES